MISRFSQDMNRTMTEDQFHQVVDAILNGKYSWACVLILQFAGYSPLHYIPYRTYNRLIKDNCLSVRNKKLQQEGGQTRSLAVDDLPHLLNLDDRPGQIRGGYGSHRNHVLFGIYNMIAEGN